MPEAGGEPIFLAQRGRQARPKGRTLEFRLFGKNKQRVLQMTFEHQRMNLSLKRLDMLRFLDQMKKLCAAAYIEFKYKNETGNGRYNLET